MIDLIFSSEMASRERTICGFNTASRLPSSAFCNCAPGGNDPVKAFIQERERFDGADVLHLLGSLGPTLDWSRLLERFGQHWRVLFASIVLFGYVYPSEIDCIPAWVSESLSARFSAERADPTTSVCRGTLLSRAQYRWDIEQLGYTDARIQPVGPLTRDDLAVWDAAIEDVPQP
jgi:hypothetical protein